MKTTPRAAAVAPARAAASRPTAGAETTQDDVDGANDPENPDDDEDEIVPGEAAAPAAAIPARASVDHAKTISASAEGKANPQAALAAIDAGLTFDQFKKMSSVSGAGAKGGTLGRALANVPAVGSDAAVKTESSLVARARAMRDAAAK